VSEAGARRRVEKTQFEPRAHPDFALDALDGEVQVSLWRNVDGDELDSMETEFVSFPVELSCQALHAHF